MSRQGCDGRPWTRTLWLLLGLLPACWEIRTWLGRQGLRWGAHRVSLTPGSIWTLHVIMQVIINQQELFRGLPVTRQTFVLWLPSQACWTQGPSDKIAAHTVSARRSGPLHSCSKAGAGLVTWQPCWSAEEDMQIRVCLFKTKGFLWKNHREAGEGEAKLRTNLTKHLFVKQTRWCRHRSVQDKPKAKCKEKKKKKEETDKQKPFGLWWNDSEADQLCSRNKRKEHWLYKQWINTY